MFEVAFRQRVHAVIVLAGIQDIGEQHRVIDGRDIDLVRGEDREVVFDVLADLEDGRVFEHRFQRAQGIRHANLAGRIRAKHVAVTGIVRIDMGERDVAGLVGGQGERDPDKICDD